jgi:hypothetical protein
VIGRAGLLQYYRRQKPIEFFILEPKYVEIFRNEQYETILIVRNTYHFHNIGQYKIDTVPNSISGRCTEIQLEDDIFWRTNMPMIVLVVIDI